MRTSGLKQHLSLEQTESLGLVTKANKLQANVTFLNRRIQRCEVPRKQTLQDLAVCSCANTATSVTWTEHNQQVIISTMQQPIDRLRAEKSELNCNYQLMLTENQKAKQNISKLNKQITTILSSQKLQLESRPTDDGQSLYDWLDLLESRIDSRKDCCCCQWCILFALSRFLHCEHLLLSKEA